MPDASPIEPARVPVALGDRGYDIVVGTGLLAAAGSLVRNATSARRLAVITDSRVGSLHLETLQAALQQEGFTVVPVVLEPGEESKSFATLQSVLDHMLKAEMERADAVIALGGGVVGDVAGLAASLFKRGIDLVQIPTTLLAQVDSSVGGKTGINTKQGKNLVGTFYQPRLVLADTGVLDTLPKRELRAGYAEIVKYGVIDDADFFGWLEKNGDEVLVRSGAARIHAIVTSCRAKARIVAADERETLGPRALLNLGHTFAHALEAATGLSNRLLHGEAVALGLVLALEFSADLKLAPEADAQRLAAHLKHAGLPTRLCDLGTPAPSAEALLQHMAQDKKKAAGRLTFVLTRGIGRAFLSNNIEPSRVLEFLRTRV